MATPFTGWEPANDVLGQAWFVISTTLLLICILYILLFFVFPKTEKSARMAWAICVPLALILLDAEILIPPDYLSSPARQAIRWIALALFVAPAALTLSSLQTPRWLRGRGRLLLIPIALSGVVLADLLRQFWPNFLDSRYFLPALVGYVALMVVAAIIKDRRNTAS